MKTTEQLRAKYLRIEQADKALRTFLQGWKSDHTLSFQEVSELLEGAQMDSEAGDLSYRDISVDEILKDVLG
jgi:hypothetical protein